MLQKSPAINLPNQIRDEIPTMNQFGYMKIDLDEFCKDFIDYSRGAEGVVLELGCAYGFVVRQVLEGGGKIVAGDLSNEHLSVLVKQTKEQDRENLHIAQGRFPEGFNFKDDSFDAILSSRMFHFLEGEEIKAGLDKVYKFLKPSGKFFFTSVSPYNYTLRDGFLDIYKKRVEEKEEWPGVVRDFNERAKEHVDYLQNFIHAFDTDHLNSLLPKHGFEIEKIKYFDYPNNIDSDNKGHIGFVARKVAKN